MLENPVSCAPQSACIGGVERPTVMVELQRRRDRAVKQLEDIDTAIRLFTEQPALEQALTSIGRLGINW